MIEAIWKTQLATAKAALRKAKLTAKQIAAIGITNQRETTLLWDRETGRPIHRHRLARPPHGQGLRLLKAAATPRHPPQNGSRDRRLFFRHQNCVAAQACERRARLMRQGRLAFGTTPAHLELTGTVHVTDASNASRTMLYNLRNRLGCRITEAIQGSSQRATRGARLE